MFRSPWVELASNKNDCDVSLQIGVVTAVRLILVSGTAASYTMLVCCLEPQFCLRSLTLMFFLQSKAGFLSPLVAQSDGLGSPTQQLNAARHPASPCLFFVIGSRRLILVGELKLGVDCPHWKLRRNQRRTSLRS